MIPALAAGRPPFVPAAPASPPPSQRDAALRAAAQQIETNFLAEMLQSAGLGKTSDAFGGGAGEDQFGSFLRRAQAESMVESGGIGLAETIFHALKERADAR